MSSRTSNSIRFRDLGISVYVLAPGKPSTMYHAESAQESFLVLQGECLLIVEGEERRLGAWDFFHCAPHTRHAFVGIGDAPCVILMAGARPSEGSILYPRDETALKHAAGSKRTRRSLDERVEPLEHGDVGQADQLGGAAG